MLLDFLELSASVNQVKHRDGVLFSVPVFKLIHLSFIRVPAMFVLPLELVFHFELLHGRLLELRGHWKVVSDHVFLDSGACVWDLGQHFEVLDFKRDGETFFVESHHC